MAKPIPKHIEKLGKIWVLINQGHKSDNPIQDRKYKKARSLLWELNKDLGVWINPKTLLIVTEYIDNIEIDGLKGIIHHGISDHFDYDLYDSMKTAEHYNWKWERIVDDYNGKPYTKNDHQYNIWHDLMCTIRSVGKQISFDAYKRKYKNKDEITDQLQTNYDFIRKRMRMLQK